MSREDMADLERQLVVVTDALNEKFAYVEFAAERNSEMLERKETEMHRLLLVMESFLNAQRWGSFFSYSFLFEKYYADLCFVSHAQIPTTNF